MFGKAVKKSGLKTGDVIVQSGNYTKRTTEGEFHSDIRLNYYRPGSILELKVLRKGEPLGISVKF
jgi:S1-C subfamily serine protease